MIQKSLSAVSQEAGYDMNGKIIAGVQITGTFVGTLTFEGTIDGVNYNAIALNPIGGGAAVTTATAVGGWRGEIGPMVRVRVRCTAYTSGAAVVNIVSGWNS